MIMGSTLGLRRLSIGDRIRKSPGLLVAARSGEDIVVDIFFGLPQIIGGSNVHQIILDNISGGFADKAWKDIMAKIENVSVRETIH